jgi:hypothetical protein
MSGKEHEVVIDFLDAWRFCPVASSPNPSRQCLENAATQLLDALPVRDTERRDDAREEMLDRLEHGGDIDD